MIPAISLHHGARAAVRRTGLSTALVLALGWFLAAPAGAQSFAELYEAAKAEGTVNAYGGPNVNIGKELTAAFAKDFPGITLNYVGTSSNGAAAKMRAEDRAGISTTDILLLGTGGGITLLKPDGVLQKLPPLLIPEVTRDAPQWRGGKFTYADADQMVMVVLGQQSIVTTINTALVKPGEVTSDMDLLDPKWKGKLVVVSPLGRGPGIINFSRFYDLHGADYVRKLVTTQEPVFSKDQRQVADWLAKGQYPIAIGLPATVSQFLISRGANNIKPLSSQEWKEPMVNTPGWGCLMVPKRPAHPAAARLFANWLLTENGQLAFSKGVGAVSLRRDVSQDHVPTFARLYEGDTYIEGYTEAFVKSPTEKKVRELVVKLGVK